MQTAECALTIRARYSTIRAFYKGLNLTTRVIPSYSLYGVQAEPAWQSWFDFEWIPQRSRPYNWKIRPHQHDALIQILYLTQGSGEVLIDHSRTRFTAPCLIVIPAQTVHGFDFSEDVDGPVITAAQRPLESMVGLTSPAVLVHLRKPAVITLDGTGDPAQTLMPLFLAIEREAQVQSDGQVTAGMALLTAICILLARLTPAHEVSVSQASSRKAAQIEKFRRMVDDNFKKHLRACGVHLRPGPRSPLTSGSRRPTATDHSLGAR